MSYDGLVALVGLRILPLILLQLGDIELSAKTLRLCLEPSFGFVQVGDGALLVALFCLKNLGLCQTEETLQAQGKLVVVGQQVEFSLRGELLLWNEGIQLCLGTIAVTTQRLDACQPDVAFVQRQLLPPEVTDDVLESRFGGIEVPVVELRPARKQPGIVHVRVVFFAGQPQFVFGGVLVLLPLGFGVDALGLNALLALVYGGVEGIGGLFVNLVVDGMERKPLRIIVLRQILLHALQTLLVGIFSVEVDVVFRGQSSHTSVELGVRLASNEQPCHQQR